MGLSALIGKHLSEKLTRPMNTSSSRSKSSTNSTARSISSASFNKPIIQLSAFPTPLDVVDYQDPVTVSNSGGDYITLYAFRELVSTVPLFQRYFLPSNYKIEDLYGNIVNNALVEGSSPFFRDVFHEAQQKLELYALPSLAGVADTWLPVYAIPSDWYDLSKKNRFTEISIDLSENSGSDSSYTHIGSGSEELNWIFNEDNSNSISGDNIKAITFNALEVRLNRPWLNPEVFDLNGWYLTGQRRGLYSSGNILLNTGIFPLLPTSILIAKDLKIVTQPNTNPKFLSTVSRAIDNNESVSVGPFVVSSKNNSGSVSRNIVASSSLHVVAWISTQNPIIPKIDDPNAVFVSSFDDAFSTAFF